MSQAARSLACSCSHAAIAARSSEADPLPSASSITDVLELLRMKPVAACSRIGSP